MRAATVVDIGRPGNGSRASVGPDRNVYHGARDESGSSSAGGVAPESATPVRIQAPESWPATLRAAARLLSAAREPTAIGGGPGLLALRNDAFAAIVDAEPNANGAARPLREVCGALWPRLEPLVDGAVGRGESLVLEDQLFCSDRRGYAEETYLRCACGPVLDGDGRIRGVMITLAPTTEQVLSVRRTAALRDVAAESAATCSIDDACARALGAVARHPSDIPFALLYMRDGERGRARLVAAAGVPRGAVAGPESIDLDSSQDDSGWPVAAALQANASITLDDVVERFGTLPAGGWPFAPRSAVVLPVTSPGHDGPDAALVAGVSARHPLDAQYRAFIELMGKQIAAAIAGGRVYEEEERRAAARAAARRARARRRARIEALKARFAGVLEERTRLAREIHDTLLQGATGVALQLRAVLPHVRTSPETAIDALERIVELAEKTSHEARQAVWDIRPAELSDGEFVKTLELAARRLTTGTPIAVRISVAGHVRRSPVKHQATVARIVQEAVANAVRHGRPRTIRVAVSYGARRLRVGVRDDGRGFSVEKDFRSYTGHWGLVGMQERARALGGELTVRSAPGHGTSVALELPYAASRRRTTRAADDRT